METETLRKALPGLQQPWASVTAVAGRVGRGGVVLLALAAGFALSAVAARPSGGGTTAPTASTAATTATTAAAATTTVSTAPSVLVVSGHGFGHGLGLAQWGAAGYAQHGWSFDRILAHYYPGTALEQAPGRTLRVLVAQGRAPTLSSGAPWTVVDSTGVRVALDPGAVRLTPALGIPGHSELVPPLSFTSPVPLAVGGRAYRGKLVASSDGKTVSVVDYVSLEQYLKGVVPAEMPSGWPAEALKAQAVAARSYALANLASSGPFDLYGDTRSQVYGGVAVETDAASAAVAATAGRVVTYDGQVADTLFHASSGGRTASSLEATGRAVPYLVSVKDPYDVLSPYHDWGPVLLDAAKAAKTLKLGSPIAGVQAESWPSGRVKTLTLTTDEKTADALTGNQARLAFGLRSTWFQVALLRLQTSRRAITWGGSATLSGSAAGAGGVSLEARPSGARAWTPAAPLSPDTGGAFTLPVSPRVTTAYRLAAGDVRAGEVTVAVAARVAAALDTGGVSGTARPSEAGAPVELQHLSGSAWTTVSSTVTDAAGAFAFGGSLAAGTYRVRVSPGHGVAPGVSAPLPVR